MALCSGTALFWVESASEHFIAIRIHATAAAPISICLTVGQEAQTRQHVVLERFLTPYQPRHHKIFIDYFGWRFIASSICLAELFNAQNDNKEKITFECTM